MSAPRSAAPAEAHALILRLAAEGIMGIAGMFRHASIASIEAYMRDLAAHREAKKGMRQGAQAWLRTLASIREREACGGPAATPLPRAEEPAP